MSLYLVVLLGLLIFLILPLKVRMLVAFIVMTRCFDFVPAIVNGIDIWDCGTVLFLISSIPLIFSKSSNIQSAPLYLTAFKAFYAWLLFCLVWSLLGYQYPWLHTLKVARQMVIGYMFLFIFIKLFMSDKECLPFFIRWLYIFTYALLPVCIVQTLFKVQIMYSLSQAYGSLSRLIPIFFSIMMFYVWKIIAVSMSDQRIKFHEALYLILALMVTALTYTRGIYLSFVAVLLLLMFNLFYDKRLKVRRLMVMLVIAILCLPLLAASGSLDSVFERFSSGFNLVVSNKSSGSKRDVDSFKGRMALTKERFDLVMERNPIAGYGFLHEDDVPSGLRNSFKFGSVITTPEYLKRYRYSSTYVLAFYSADIGWANLTLMTGFVGLLIFILFLGLFFLNYYKPVSVPATLYHLRLAFYLQTVMMAILMFNGDTFVSKLQIVCYMMAGYAVSTYRGGQEADPLNKGMKPI